MNIYTNTNSPFPSQVVSDAEKASLEYGSQVAQAIEQEWFSQGRTSGNRYLTNWNNFHMLRSYARGEQSIRKYKDAMSLLALHRFQIGFITIIQPQGFVLSCWSASL